MTSYEQCRQEAWEARGWSGPAPAYGIMLDADRIFLGIDPAPKSTVKPEVYPAFVSPPGHFPNQDINHDYII